MDILIEMLKREANEKTIEGINNGTITLDDDRELISAFIGANVSSNDQILDILECMVPLIMGDTMETEYVVFFINRVRELSDNGVKIAMNSKNLFER